MGVVIGIDVGGSTTKIVGFGRGQLISPMLIRADDPVTSIYGAFGKFIDENALSLSEIEKVMVTGVGSSYITKPIYGLECVHLPEFPCVGQGGLYLTSLGEAIIVSMGTGTALVHAKRGEGSEYLGGTGVGGGTLMGISKKLLGLDNVENIVELAAEGDLTRVDLRMEDISKTDIIPGKPSSITVANFGKVGDLSSRADLALGTLNMVFETVGMLAVFAARSRNLKDIIISGNLATFDVARERFGVLSDMFKMNMQIPDNAQFATVIGAALIGSGGNSLD